MIKELANKISTDRGTLSPTCEFVDRVFFFFFLLGVMLD